MQVTVIFTEARSFTLELVDAGIYETEKEYEVFIGGVNAGRMKTNLGGKLVLSIEIDPGQVKEVRVVKL